MTTTSSPIMLADAPRHAEHAELRERAEAVLKSLLHAKAECERHVARFRRPDAMKAIRGESALDRAINSTRRTIQTLERTMAEFDGLDHELRVPS